MKELVTIKRFNDYFDELNESLIEDNNSRCDDVFLHYSDDEPTKGPDGKLIPAKPIIRFADGGSVTPQEIVDVVQTAITYLKTQYRRTFYFANHTMNIIYLAHSKRHKTMSVDKHMNMYLNAGFVYNHLKMDPILVAAVIMHEVFHVVYNHIERSENWLSAQGKQATRSNWNDTNLAADVEVNQTLVKVGLIDEEKLVNVIRGIYLSNTHGSKDILTLEMILNNDELMAKLRAMHPVPPDPEKGERETIKTTDDWDGGYKDGWNGIAEIAKKYGYKKTWEQLQSVGIINGDGEILVTDVKKVHDKLEQVKDNLFVPGSMEFLQVKSYDDFVNENEINEGKNSDQGKTYDDGYMTGLSKVISVVNHAIKGNEGGGGGGGTDTPDFEHNIDTDDLIGLDLPDNDDEDDDGDGGDSLPTNVNQKSKPNKNKKSKPESENDESQDDSGENDMKNVGKMADDLRNKLDHGEKQEDSSGQNSEGNQKEESDDDEALSNGGFLNDDDVPTDDELKESGYSDEDIKNINEVRKSNQQKNSPERLKKIMNDYKNQMDNPFIGKLMDRIDVESKKYKNIWEDILKKFLSNKTRRAGKALSTGFNDWKNKKKIALGDYGLHRQKQAQDPQDVNIYVDVSGSMDMDLLEIIAKSLVILSEQNQYSGINVCPWASNSTGVFKIDSMYKQNKDKVVSDILAAISTGQAKGGGGTESTALISALLDCVEENLKDPNKKAKDDVHVIITDGYISGYEGIEKDMEDVLFKSFGRRDIAEKAPKNTFWMLYDTSESIRKSWEDEIQKGVLIFINSETVKNNKKV